MKYRSRPFELEAVEFQPGPGPLLTPEILVGGYRVAYKLENQGSRPLWKLWCQASKTWCTIEPGDYIALEPPREPGADPVGMYPIQKHVFQARWEPVPRPLFVGVDELGTPVPRPLPAP